VRWEPRVHTQSGIRARTAAARRPRHRRKTPSGRSETPTTCTHHLHLCTELRKRVHHFLLHALVRRRRQGFTVVGKSRWLTESGRARDGDEAHHAARSPRSRTRRRRPLGAPPGIGRV